MAGFFFALILLEWNGNSDNYDNNVHQHHLWKESVFFKAINLPAKQNQMETEWDSQIPIVEHFALLNRRYCDPKLVLQHRQTYTLMSHRFLLDNALDRPETLYYMRQYICQCRPLGRYNTSQDYLYHCR